MQYGASIVPKTFFDTKPQFFTKQAFANYMARALQTVGMVPLNAINAYDLADPAKAEYDPGASSNAGYFWWDYPTTETYELSGVPYRPCVGLGNMILRVYDASTTTVGGKTAGYYVGMNVYLKPYRRRADRFSRADMKCYENTAFTRDNSFGFGDQVDDVTTYANQYGGSIVGWNLWKLSATDNVAQHTELLFINRVFIHLGKAGLVVQVGTHPTRRDETCNIFNFAHLFHGGRIPNRAMPVGDDVLRDLTDPTLWLDFGHYSDAAFANSTRAEMTASMFGGTGLSNNTKYTTTGMVGGTIRSIDYMDAGALNNAPLDNYTRPSPAVLDGAGVHALHRACLISGYGRVDTIRQPNGAPVTRWADAFYFPGFALGDRVVAPGPRRDPRTNKDWYMIWATPRGQAFGLDYDGVVTTPVLSSGAEVLTLEETIPIDVTAIDELQPAYTRTANRSQPASEKIGHTRTLLGTFGGVQIYVNQREYMSIDSNVANRWTKPTGVNGFSILNLGTAVGEGAIYNRLNFEFSGLSTDPRDFYWVEYEYRGRVNNSPGGDPASENYFYTQNYFGSGDDFVGDAAIDWFNYLRVGATVSYQNFYYNYAVYGVRGAIYPVGAPYTAWSVDRFQPNSAGRAQVQFGAAKNYATPSAIYSPSYDIKNIVLKRYRRA